MCDLVIENVGSGGGEVCGEGGGIRVQGGASGRWGFRRRGGYFLE